MLFTDGDIVSSAGLLRIDSEIAAVAGVTKPAILLEGPGSICEQTWGECGRRITSAMQTYVSTFSFVGVGGGHQSAVNYTGGPARNQSRTRLNQVVASESQYANTISAVELWMAYTALSLFYRDASARMGKDRLQDKYDRYTADADFAWRQLRQNGLPFVSQPLEAPGARHGINAGTWALANLSAAAGSGTRSTLQVAITYYDASRYRSESNTGNAESGPSAILQPALVEGTVLSVSIASLNPPTGVMDPVGLSQGALTPLIATHWNLFVGIPGGALYWQAAVPIATKTYTLAGDPVLSGPTLQLGQVPESMLTFSHIVGRG